MSSSDFSASGLTLRGVELGAHVRHLGVGAQPLVLQPRELQRGKLRPRHGLGLAVVEEGFGGGSWRDIVAAVDCAVNPVGWTQPGVPG